MFYHSNKKVANIEGHLALAGVVRCVCKPVLSIPITVISVICKVCILAYLEIHARCQILNVNRVFY